MRIVFLYAEMVPSWIPTLETLVKQYGANVTFIHWDGTKTKTPFIPPRLEGVEFIPRSRLNALQIEEILKRPTTDAVVISGWMDRGYLSAVRSTRARGTPVISCFDDWWVGSLRQKIGAAIFPYYLRNYFSHAWVSGPRQYEFARRLGFEDESVIHNLLTCNVDLFRAAADVSEPKLKYMMYVGRFAEEKGVRILAAAVSLIREKSAGNDISVRCYGNGPLEGLLRECGAEVYQFADQVTLANLMAKARAVIIPSKRDFSPLVLHEATCSGAPVIVSDMVGNRNAYAVDNWNGKVFAANNTESLINAILRINSWTDEECKIAGERSLELSMKNSPKICAASLVSILNAN